MGCEYSLTLPYARPTRVRLCCTLQPSAQGSLELKPGNALGFTKQKKHTILLLLQGVETVVPEGFTLSDHLAIDWIARNLYWTCPAFNKIYVSRLDGSEIIVVVDTDLEEPRGVAVDPGDG